MLYPLQMSVVVPLFNEEESLPELAAWIERVLTTEKISYEVLLIDDGSRDNSWPVIEKITKKHTGFRGIRFARNYGKSAALHVGFQEALGEVVVTMDADLQDSPDELPALYKMITEEGYDLVSGWKQKRFDPITKTLPTKLFNGVSRWVSGVQLHDFNCGLKAYHAPVVKSVRLYGEMHRNIPILAKWNGFTKIGEKVVQHQARKYGKTKFGIERFVYGFLDMLTIVFVNRFGKRPMHLFGTLGVLSFLVGFGITTYLIIKKIYLIATDQVYRNITENPLFFLALVAAIIGVQLFVAGFLGELSTSHADRTTEYNIRERA